MVASYDIAHTHGVYMDASFADAQAGRTSSIVIVSSARSSILIPFDVRGGSTHTDYIEPAVTVNVGDVQTGCRHVTFIESDALPFPAG